MAERKWTHYEAAQLIDMAQAGLTTDEIGEVLDRTTGAVRVKATRIGVDGFYQRDTGKFPEKRRDKKLPCKMCSQPMISSWSGHRICDDCKKTELYRYS
ncbi:hypothetical protein ASF69_01795 [Rhizobium sp. Leaf311]|uniref:hypothetical protein n=1 Tax=Rhizobium sp. Leaf311 TaxID=1736332 RepID=UPI000713A7F0|nr:hypothetical protein [Rhizobium sp. Leaf311]KQQ61183.1 hypothetical protein ASF69_01795 [Rhizobium sp. Leaf311]